MKKIKIHLGKLLLHWKEINNKRRILVVISFIYLFGITLYLMRRGSWVSPDHFFFFALIAALLLGRVKSFIWDWIPVVFLFLGYEYVRGLVPLLNKTVHIYPMINIDRQIFGTIPTIELQEYLSPGNSVHWYDYLSVILYMSHFIMPMMVGFLFWIRDRNYFRKYMAGLLFLSYITFLTYLIFPAMPPWMAAEQGYLPPIKKITDNVVGIFASPIVLPTIYKFFGANLVAAVPSLHAAFPWLIFLYVVKRIKRFGLILIPYVLGVWFAVVYLGDHYVFDVLLGILYATISFVMVTRFKWIKNKVTSIYQVFNQVIRHKAHEASE